MTQRSFKSRTFVWVELTLIVVVLCAGTHVSGETIFLKDGGVWKGKIVSSNATNVVIRTANGQLTVPQKEILRIDYSDATASVNAPATVILRDGSSLIGIIEEQTEENLSLATSIGILTVLKSNIAEIRYGAKDEKREPAQATNSPNNQPVNTDPRATWQFSPGYFFPIGTGQRFYNPGSGGRVQVDTSFRSGAFSVGIQPMYYQLPGKQAGEGLSVFATSIVGSAHLYFADRKFRLSPFAGIGGAMYSARWSAPENDLAAQYYFYQKGDQIGQLLTYIVPGNPDLKNLSAFYFASRGDPTGYVLVDRRNLTHEKTGAALSLQIGLGTMFWIRENIGIGTTVQLGLEKIETEGLGHGSATVDISIRF